MRIVSIVFSPTGGTARAAGMVTGTWGQPAETVDLSDPSADFSAVSLAKDDLVLIAVPSFGGRVPAVAVQRLSRVQGSGALCALLCVYGNRAYEDTLIELFDTAKACGFRVIAGMAAIAEHSIMHQYATGRPDKQDEHALQDFAEKIMEKAKSGSTSEPSVPGSRPYKKAGGAALVPKAGSSCVACGLCAAKCPVQAIDKNDPRRTDSKKCISCMRCVSICPHSARKINEAMVSVAALAIKKACSVKKECELYL